MEGGGGEKLGCLKLYSEGFEGGIVRTQAAKPKLGYFAKFLNFKIHIFWTN